MARDEGWIAEHMLILKLTSPEQQVPTTSPPRSPAPAARPTSRCSTPTIPGWKVETLGDDIAWMRFGEDGRLYAVNPEFGFFGVAPGTNEHTNPNAMRTINKGNSVFTNVALTDDGDVWWEGLENTPAHATSWKGEDWTPESRASLSSHPNSRYCTPIEQCPILADGVRRPAAASRSRRSSSAAAARRRSRSSPSPATGSTAPSWARRSPRRRPPPRPAQVGVVRRDPMAMLPFIGYNAGDYFGHWIDIGKDADAAKLPKIFYVNWFRRDDDGGFLWPGFGENSRVSEVGHRAAWRARPPRSRPRSATCPTPDSLDTDGLDLTPEQVAPPLAVDPEEWKAEIPQIEEWFDKFGDNLPTAALDRARRPQGPPRPALTRPYGAPHGAPYSPVTRRRPPAEAGGRRTSGCARSQTGRTFSACGPLGPCVTSNSTRCASSSER